MAEYIARGGLTEPNSLFQSSVSNSFYQPQHSKSVSIGRVLGVFERGANLSLGAQVVDLRRLNLADDTCEMRAFRQVAEVQFQLTFSALVGVEVLDSGLVVVARFTYHSVHFVTFG